MLIFGETPIKYTWTIVYRLLPTYDEVMAFNPRTRGILNHNPNNSNIHATILLPHFISVVQIS